MERVPALSVRGLHVVPLLVDFQTPPSAAPENSEPSGAEASEVMRPATQRSPAPELLKLLLGSMYWGESEKSTPGPVAGVRSTHGPPTVGRELAAGPTAANAL